MEPFQTFPAALKRQIRYVLTDIDDTLTLDGKLPAIAYLAMERLQAAGIRVVPITGRPAGWCDHIARMWPVDGVVGENGAFYFFYDHTQRTMLRQFWRTGEQRTLDRVELLKLQEKILREVPGTALSADQPYREADLAIDFCEDVPPLPSSEVEKIVKIFASAGAQAKISSIHVNGWFGDCNKQKMTARLFSEVFKTDLEQEKEHIIFAGDSPNDGPMFAYFPHAVGVANIMVFADRLPHKPGWVTKGKGGFGFAEMVDFLLAP